MNKKVYYAHFMGIYDTPQEKRDVETLEKLGLEVFNPNVSKIQIECKIKFKHADSEEKYKEVFAKVFFPRIEGCDVFAFRSVPDGRIPGGVVMELQEAQRLNKVIIELPCGTYARSMSKNDTQEYLRDLGQR